MRRGGRNTAVTTAGRRLVALGLALGMLLSIVPASLAKPAGLGHLSVPTELAAHLDGVVAAHPQIARKFSIGKSYEGRDIWALKISDNVTLDEDEPEVVIVAQIHAREWVSQSLALYIIELLTRGYGTDPRITQIVDGAEIFVVPTLNPDGAEHDLGGSAPRSWRKNRQPIKGSTSVGIDLNRNFGFNWACCGGGSNNPPNDKYRGWSPWVAPEVVAYRDFVNSRVVGGRQQLALSLTFHSAGEMVLWPYAYTKAALPKTMSADDYAGMAALGRALADRNGYRPMQGSKLYVADGDHDDWLYYQHRVFALTFELAPFAKRYYPTAAEATAEASRNREAVLYFLEQADCPHRAAGLAATHCGPLNDDFETARGWTVNPFATDTATKGRFERGLPAKNRTAAGIKQRKATPSGQAAFSTGLARGASANANDLDGGVTSVASPAVAIGPGKGWWLNFRYTFAHDARARSNDWLRVSVIEGSSRSVLWSQAGKAAQRNSAWTAVTLNLDAYAGRTVRLLFEAADNGADALVEAAFDDVRVYRLP
jgi:carboxypeptidase T